jgi:hypothetical protein
LARVHDRALARSKLIATRERNTPNPSNAVKRSIASELRRIFSKWVYLGSTRLYALGQGQAGEVASPSSFSQGSEIRILPLNIACPKNLS